MKRLLLITCAVAVAAAFAVAGCTSSGGTSGSSPAADTASGEDTAAKTDSSATRDGTAGATGDAAPGGDTAAKDTASPCGTCKSDEICNEAAKKCEPKPKTDCDPLCKVGTEYCDLAAKPPVCKAQTCKFPTNWGPTIQGVSKLQLGDKSVGCDLDGDGKVNNALAGALAAFLGQANGALDKGIKDGSIAIQLESTNFKSDGGEFAVNLLVGDLDKSNATCDITSGGAKCKYTVSDKSYDPKVTAATCPALINFPNCKIKSGKLSGGGKNQLFLFTLPIPNLSLTLKISQATIEGEVVAAAGWDKTSKGLICGVLGKQDIVDAVNAIPDEQIAKFGIGDKKTIIDLVTGLLKPDIDVDGDGVAESASVALQWESTTAEILGMTAK